MRCREGSIRNASISEMRVAIREYVRVGLDSGLKCLQEKEVDRLCNTLKVSEWKPCAEAV